MFPSMTAFRTPGLEGVEECKVSSKGAKGAKKTSLYAAITVSLSAFAYGIEP